jgi:hypothetical protein
VNLVSRVSKFGRRRVVALFIGPMAVALSVASPVAFVTQVSAATTVAVAITLNEPKQFDLVSGCAVFLAREGLCGRGVAVPYGHATETIVFGGCGFGGPVRCDLRIVTVASGSIFLDGSQATSHATTPRRAPVRLRSPTSSRAERAPLPARPAPCPEPLPAQDPRARSSSRGRSPRPEP